MNIIYKGMLLKDYCTLNNINYELVCKAYKKRIRFTSSSKYTTEQLLDIIISSIDEYKEEKCKYYIDGEPLLEYCKKHPDLNHRRILDYLSRNLDSDKSSEELIKEYISKKHKTYNKYNINGMSLKRYCMINNINYINVSRAISREKSNPKNNNKDINEIIQKVLDDYLLDTSNIVDFMSNIEEEKKLELTKKENK